MELASKYNPAEVEAKWYQYWLDHKLFSSKPDGRQPYTIVIPPPNVTGVLHMGHMLNNTIQDILVRRARMEGKNACWVPGTDHASIATEAKVVNRLAEQGIKKSDLTREEFLKHAWAWTEEHGGIILKQLRKLGASCDWDRTAFTMDEERSKSVIKVFVDLYNKGLIYRGVRMVNWDPKALTALSDEEVIYKEEHSKLYYLRYYVADDDLSGETGAEGEVVHRDAEGRRYAVVATTRPETIMGDTAMCINPNDVKNRWLSGKKIIVPLVGRVIPVIEDDYVDIEFGTGCLKVTPAHDVNDYMLGEKYNLPSIDIFNDNGTLSEAAGLYVGQDRFDVRRQIEQDLQEAGLLEKVEAYTNKVGFSERTNVPIEPKLSMQWFLKMQHFADMALPPVMNDELKFYPPKYKNTYKNWLENIKDWCISRQLWWGHRIPAYFLPEGGYVVAATPDEALRLAQEKTGRADLKMEDLRQDSDCLDTWFSSWLWPFSTLGWPEKTADLDYYYPTCDLVTAQDIIFFWVARMMMAGIHFMKKPPFRNIVIHGIVRAADGSKMSKSKGNSLDPLELIDQYSADALRFSIALITSLDCDTKVNKEKFEIGRNFSTKIWNAAKFLDMNVQTLGELPDLASLTAADLSADDKHMLIATDKACKKLSEILEGYRIQDGALAVYDFIWDQLCGGYVEYAKDAPNKKVAFAVLKDVFYKALRLLHPYMPFVTEEVAHQLGFLGENETIMRQSYPTGYTEAEKAAWGLSDDVYEFVNAKREAITALRALRHEYKVTPATFVKVTLATDDAKAASEVESLKKAMRAESVDFVAAGSDLPMPSKITKFGTVYLSLEGLVDKAAESKRIAGELAKLAGFIKGKEAKLGNANFVAHAPEAVVAEEKRKLAETQEKVAQLEKLAKLFA